MYLREFIGRYGFSNILLVTIFLLYSVLFVISPDHSLFFKSITYSKEIILRILPIIFLVYVLLLMFNYFDFSNLYSLKNSNHLLFASIIGGILSSGPIYLWYPLLSEMHRKGLSYKYITIFLYNRAIKLPLIPIMVSYFGWFYVLLLSFLMVIFSIFNGYLVEMLTRGVKK